MKVIETSRLDRDVSGFFAENAISHKKYTSGDHNLSVDGTGKDASVTSSIGAAIASYILKKFKADTLRVMDLGTGKGHLPNEMARAGIDAYGLEGAGGLAGATVYDHNKIVCCDLSVPIIDERLNKAFDLTTSFELIEHIHRSHEDQFIKNLVYLSDWHLCSINVDEWPGITNNHCNIKHPCCWGELFRRHNIGCEFIGAAPKAKPAWAHEAFIPIQYSPGAHSEEFRDNVRHEGWDEWPFSIFCILDMREAYR